MKKYRLFVNGRNFFFKEDKNVAKYGFYTNVFVEAKNEKQAEEKGITILRNDKELKKITVNKPDDSPILSVKEIEELMEWPEGVSWPRTGLALYDGSEDGIS